MSICLHLVYGCFSGTKAYSRMVVTETQRPAKPKLLCDPLQKVCWARANQPSSGPLLREGGPSLHHWQWASSQGMGAQKKRDKGTGIQNLLNWGGGVLGNHWPAQGVIISLFLKKHPASFPKRSEAGPKGRDVSSAKRGTVCFIHCWSLIMEQMNRHRTYVCESGTMCTLFEDKWGTG